MGYDLTTKHGYNMYDMSSLLQKAIRRADVEKAAYAANELYERYNTYLWKRLLTVSAEDCYGIMTKEIVALQQADDFVNKGKKGDDRNTLFVAKAVILLCLARKNRDADYVACNFMYPDRTLDPDEIEHLPLEKAHLDGGIPDYVYDCHTRKGKIAGKTKLDMIHAEGDALQPRQMSLFDNAPWDRFFDEERKNGCLSDREWRQVSMERERRKYEEARQKEARG